MPIPVNLSCPPPSRPRQGRLPQGAPPTDTGLDPHTRDALAYQSIWGPLPYILSARDQARVDARAAEIAGASGRPPDLAQSAFARFRSQHPVPHLEVRGPRPAGRWTASEIGEYARLAGPLRDASLPFANGDWNLATGWAAALILESLNQTHARENRGRGPGRGLMQLTDLPRRANFRSQMGVDIDHANLAQQLGFGLDYERNFDRYESRMWCRALAGGHDPASIASGITRCVLRPDNWRRDAAERAAVAAAMPPFPPRRSEAPPPTPARVPAANASTPARRFVFDPVHGG